MNFEIKCQTCGFKETLEVLDYSPFMLKVYSSVIAKTMQGHTNHLGHYHFDLEGRHINSNWWFVKTIIRWGMEEEIIANED